MTTKSHKVLESALDLLISHGICRGHYALDHGGHPVGSTSSTAACFCIAGAIDRVVDHDNLAFEEAWQVVKDRLGVAQSKAATLLIDGMSQADVIEFMSHLVGRPYTRPPRAPRSKQQPADPSLAAQLLA